MRALPQAVFVGVDLGWYGKSSGLASIEMSGDGLNLKKLECRNETDDILRWIQSEAGGGTAVVAVDAPLVIESPTGIRDVERQLNREFWQFHACCHATNLGRPFARSVVSFSRRLTDMGLPSRR